MTEEENLENESVDKARWYVVHVRSNFEARVQQSILTLSEEEGKSDVIQDVLVPRSQRTQVRSGKKRVLSQKHFPGYVLIKMIMSEENWYWVRNIPGVSGFLGERGKAVPMSEREVNKLADQGREEKEEKIKPVLDFKIGERVLVMEGLFMNMTGEIGAVNTEKGVVSVMMSIFGRQTPVEVEYSCVKKVTD